MRKNLIIPTLFVLTLCITLLPTQSVLAVSTGYERFKTSEHEVHLEYFPIVPYDPDYPTASEEFPIWFYIWQDQFYDVGSVFKLVPRLFAIYVYFRDDHTSDSDWVSWKRWYPTSTEQYGLTTSWNLGGAYGPLTISANIRGPSAAGWETNYDKYYETHDGKSYLHVATLKEEYASNVLWGEVHVEGAGSLGIPNDQAIYRHGHHILVWVHVELAWLKFYTSAPFLPIGTYWEDMDFVLGDDTPADTDCWLTVQQGNSDFARNYHLTVLAQDQYGNSPTTGDVYIDGQWCGLTGSTFTVWPGTHTIRTNSFWQPGGYRYNFTHWDGSTSNPITREITESTTVTAYFKKKWCPGDCNGDGTVDTGDAIILINAFDSGRGSPKWDSRADTCTDGDINIYDALVINACWYATYP